MKSMIYFVQETKDHVPLRGEPVKIGYAGLGWPGVRGRLSSLRSGNWREMNIVGAVRGPRALETAMHWRFRPVWLRSEWFVCTGELFDLVTFHALAPNGLPTENQDIMPAWFDAKKARPPLSSWNTAKAA